MLTNWGAILHARQACGVRGTARLAYALAATGHEGEARQTIDELLRLPHEQPPSFEMAMAYVGLGDADAAFHWLDRAYAERDAFLHTIKTVPAFDSLHVDRRWGSLLQRIGLAA